MIEVETTPRTEIVQLVEQIRTVLAEQKLPYSAAVYLHGCLERIGEIVAGAESLSDTINVRSL